MNRRNILTAAAGFAGATLNRSWTAAAAESAWPISLAQWSHHLALKGGQLDNLAWPAHAKEKFGISALEWVNQFFCDNTPKLGNQPKAQAYLAEMKKRCDDLGSKSVLIMCDGVGDLGNPDAAKRTDAVEGHYAWLDAAKLLGCHSIRVNAQSSGSYEEQIDRAADGLRKLGEFGDAHNINVIVENHGGLSSNGTWLATVMKKANHKRVGTLPDFGNFTIRRADPKKTGDKGEEYDRYKGVDELMPWAKGVSAKSHDFNAKGEEIHTDYRRMMDIVLRKHNYHGFVGIEYEGSKISEADGIRATKKLLEMILAETK